MHQQLVEYQPLSCLARRVHTLRKMHVLPSLAQTAHMTAVTHILGHKLLHAVVRYQIECIFNSVSYHLLRQTLGKRIYRKYKIGICCRKHHRRVHLSSHHIAAYPAVEYIFVVLFYTIEQIVLVIPYHRKIFGIVRKNRLIYRHTLADMRRRQLFDKPPSYCGRLVTRNASQLAGRGKVYIISGAVLQQIENIPDPHLSEKLRPLRSDPLKISYISF